MPATLLPPVQMAGDLEGECMLDLFIYLNTVLFQVGSPIIIFFTSRVAKDWRLPQTASAQAF